MMNLDLMGGPTQRCESEHNICELLVYCMVNFRF